jgi:hypothetical protein
MSGLIELRPLLSVEAAPQAARVAMRRSMLVFNASYQVACHVFRRDCPRQEPQSSPAVFALMGQRQRSSVVAFGSMMTEGMPIAARSTRTAPADRQQAQVDHSGNSSASSAQAAVKCFRVLFLRSEVRRNQKRHLFRKYLGIRRSASPVRTFEVFDSSRRRLHRRLI